MIPTEGVMGEPMALFSWGGCNVGAMDFDFFKTVGDYPKMLNKIAISTFVGAILAVWLLRHELPALDS
jgi:hypothetical protein